MRELVLYLSIERMDLCSYDFKNAEYTALICRLVTDQNLYLHFVPFVEPAPSGRLLWGLDLVPVVAYRSFSLLEQGLILHSTPHVHSRGYVSLALDQTC